MKVVVTSIKLKSVWQFFKLTYLAMHIVKQTKKEKGFLGMKNRGFGKLHFTLSVWESTEDMERFVHSGAHLEAMKHTKELASELKFYHYDAAVMPGWDEAKRLLAEKGRSIVPKQ
ncbi:MAG: DUF4188 domain-containing protein [Ignavibacteria bacterium]|nr:DUF4188 domain-containing protein [Ignavibacteria bacterium]